MIFIVLRREGGRVIIDNEGQLEGRDEIEQVIEADSMTDAMEISKNYEDHNLIRQETTITYRTRR